MAVKKRVCVVTGTRSEYGLLNPVIQRLMKVDDLKTSIVVTGSHLSPEFGLTVSEVESDGIPIDARIEILLSSDTAVGISKSMGLALIGFGEYFAQNEPDLVIVLGDRFEALAVAAASAVARIPIAHIHGGELTFGAMDDAFRHAITKLSKLHFTATEAARRRVIQMGEQPSSVHFVGSLGVEIAKSVERIPKNTLQTELGLNISRPFALVTFHPATLDDASPGDQFEEVLAALEKVHDLNIVFTMSNADMNGRQINDKIVDYERKNPDRCRSFISLGIQRYLSLLSYCDVVVGNSSSGILEAPSFGVPTVNIGSRQDGRERAASVFDCAPDCRSILSAITTALMHGRKVDVVNPYEKEHTADAIVDVIRKEIPTLENRKKYHDLGGTYCE